MKFNSHFLKKLLFPTSKFIAVLGLSASLTGCQWGDEVTSLAQPNPDDFMVLFADTSTINVSTFKFDSVMTGASTRMLVGSYTDPYFGTIQGATYFQPILENGLSLPEGAVYDSLVLNLYYDKYFYGDTTKTTEVSIHALKTDILDRSSYYNTSTMEYEAEPLVKRTLLLRPNSDSTLSLKLPNALGKKIFDTAEANQLNTNNQGLEILKGLVIRSDAGKSGSLTGFGFGRDSDQSAVKTGNVTLYYHMTTADGFTNGTFPFRIQASYTQILEDRSNTELRNLSEKRVFATPSAQLGEKGYIQEGLGVVTRIDLPYLRSLKDVKYSVPNRAFLRITPLKESVTKQMYAPASLTAYWCDHNNQPTAVLSDLSNGSTAVNANYIVDYINNTEYYLLDVSSYVSGILASNLSENGGLMLLTSSLNTSSQYMEQGGALQTGTRRLVFGTQKNPDRGIKLELYYTTVKAN
jgi:hypothetical protein